MKDSKNIVDPKNITELFNKYFVNVRPILMAKYMKVINILQFMRKIEVNRSFFLAATTPQEIYDIISAFDIKKSLEPTSIPLYIQNIYQNFFQIN